MESENAAEKTDVWIIAKETVIQVPGETKPRLGYTLLNGMPVMYSYEEAIAVIKTMKLPIGWVAMKLGQLFPNVETVA